MEGENNVQQIIAWFESLGKDNDPPHFPKEKSSTKTKFNKTHIVKEKTRGEEFKNLIDRFESDSCLKKEKTNSSKQPANGKLAKLQQRVLPKQNNVLVPIKPHSRKPRREIRNLPSITLPKRSKSNDEYRLSSTRHSGLKVYDTRIKQYRENIDCLPEESNCLAESNLEFLEDGEDNLQKKIQKQIDLLNREMERREELEVLKSQEIQSYRQIVHTPFLLAAHFLYSVFYKPRRRQNFL